MSDATKRMRDFLTKFPSVVFPDEVLELFIPVEEENAKLKELCGEMLAYILPSSKRYSLKENMAIIDGFAERCNELGMEVN